MEYDNDRLRQRTTPTETTCWVLVGCLSPLVDCAAILHVNVPGWLLAFLVSGITLPVYMIFSHLMGAPVFNRRKGRPVLLFALSFFVIGGLILSIYSLFLTFNLRPAERAYLSLNTTNLYRVAG